MANDKENNDKSLYMCIHVSAGKYLFNKIYAEQLYVKVVPQNVRDFIEMTAKRQNAAKPKSVSEKSSNQP